MSVVEWQFGKPPNEVVVEVEYEGQIIEVMAFFGRDGYRPHWTDVDRNKSWSVNTFNRWRHRGTESTKR